MTNFYVLKNFETFFFRFVQKCFLRPFLFFFLLFSNLSERFWNFLDFLGKNLLDPKPWARPTSSSKSAVFFFWGGGFGVGKWFRFFFYPRKKRQKKNLKQRKTKNINKKNFLPPKNRETLIYVNWISFTT